MIKNVPVNNVSFTGNEKKYLAECIESGWISHEGPFVQKFETEFSHYVERKYGIAVSSGSAALDIAVIAADITKGDEVIMPAFTIISPALSIIKAGAVPVLIDSDADTYNMDIDAIESKITSRTKAIMVVHMYGLPVNLDKIIAIAKKYNLKIIEDAAEMHGQTYNGKKCGSFGDISIFSFYANKIITTGEGGMILCDDDKIAEHCMKLRNLAFESRRYIHYEMGYNYRLTNLQAALGVAQLEQIDAFIEKKRSIGKYYTEHLSFLMDHGYKLPVSSVTYAENIYWVYTLVAPDELQKKECIKYLHQNNIGTRPFFICMHKQPVFNRLNLFLKDSHPNAENFSKMGFYIPSGLALVEDELEYVVSKLKSFIKKIRYVVIYLTLISSMEKQTILITAI